jgi:ribonuclease Z
MTFSVTVLGSSASIPAYGRFPSSQVVNHNEKLFLVDCGEGTQMRLHQNGFRRGRIHHIFISHLHGDHFYGLIGVLTTMNLLGRNKPVHLFSHSAILNVIKVQLEVAQTELTYELILHPLDGLGQEVIYENEVIEITTLPLNHRVPCWGFLFREKRLARRFLSEKAAQFNIPFHMIPRLKAGEDYITPSGQVVKSLDVTADPPEPRSYAYVADTAYDETLIERVSHVDLLFHESTFNEENRQRAAETFHSTALNAATIASRSGAKQLLLGHYSAKFKDLEPLLAEAKTVFDNTLLSMDGKAYTVGRPTALEV